MLDFKMCKRNAHLFNSLIKNTGSKTFEDHCHRDLKSQEHVQPRGGQSFVTEKY